MFSLSKPELRQLIAAVNLAHPWRFHAKPITQNALSRSLSTLKAITENAGSRSPKTHEGVSEALALRFQSLLN